MLAILRQCPEFGEIILDLKLNKDVNWFINYLAGTNNVFIMDQDHRSPIHIYVDYAPHAVGPSARQRPTTQSYQLPSYRKITPSESWLLSMQWWLSNAGLPNSQHRRWYCIATVLWQ